MDCVLKCVGRCYFSKRGGEDGHYHPLALKVLGWLMSDLKVNPRKWVEHLPRVRTFSNLSNENQVFDILRSSFDALSLSLQTLFMDVGFFLHEFHIGFSEPEWLCAVHNQDEGGIKHRLETLKRRGLLQDVDLASGRVTMHDLYREFGGFELRGKLNKSTDLGERQWMYVDNGDMTELKRKPMGGCWQNMTRLAITKLEDFSIEKGIKWEYFSNVEVLYLADLHCKWGALNLEPMVGLRSLVVDCVRNVYRIEGLEGLTNLTHFHWRVPMTHSYPVPMKVFVATVLEGQLPSSLKALRISGIVLEGQLPSSLKALRISGTIEFDSVLRSDVLSRCRNLRKLELYLVKIDTLDLTNCRSLQSLELSGCRDLVDIPGIDRVTELRELRVDSYSELKLPSLLALTQLQRLKLLGLKSLVRTKECFPRQLRQLKFSGMELTLEVNLDGFNQLEVLDLSNTHGLTSLEAVGGLPALWSLELSHCKNLLRLPDLSKSRNLKELNLEECLSLELHGRDIEILSQLPSLRTDLGDIGKGDRLFTLDLVRRKLQIYDHWSGDEQERDLGAPPIKIRDIYRSEMDFSPNDSDSLSDLDCDEGASCGE